MSYMSRCDHRIRVTLVVHHRINIVEKQHRFRYENRTLDVKSIFSAGRVIPCLQESWTREGAAPPSTPDSITEVCFCPSHGSEKEAADA